MKCYLISRDRRTQSLFRDCWRDALDELGFQIQTITRYDTGSINALIRFFKNRKNFNFIFGTSEICLYSLFSNEKDIWVFTGLGRLLGSGKISSILVLLYLRVLYCGQLIVTLNQQDEALLKHFFGENVKRINGEGYCFTGKKRSFDKLDKNNKFVNFVYHGRLLKSKGVERVLNLFEQHQFGKIDLYGDTDFGNSDAIDAKYRKYANRDDAIIKIRPFAENIHDLIREYDVFISLSEREGIPFSVLDALNAGLYVILSNVAGHDEFAHLPGVYVGSVSEIKAHLEKIRLNREILEISEEELNYRIDWLDQNYGASKVTSQILNMVKWRKNDFR